MGARSLNATSPDGMAELLTSLHTADGVFAVGADQRIIAWNESAARISGHRADEVLGRLCYEVMGGTDASNFRFCRRNCPTVANARRARTTPDYDICAHTADDRQVWINVSILLLREAKKRSPLMVHVFRDVTARRRVEQAAAKAMSTLRKLVGETAERGENVEHAIAPTPLPLLTKRERDVLGLLACGTETNDIAESLCISRATVRTTSHGCWPNWEPRTDCRPWRSPPAGI